MRIFHRLGRYSWWIIVPLLVLLPAAFKLAQAAPRFQAVGADGLIIVLYDEPCAIEAPMNLRYRATWRSGVEFFEGCWIPSAYGVFMFYFSDRTTVVVPTKWFVKFSGAGS